MSILENLENIISEMSPMAQLATLSQEVAVQDIETGKFLNLTIAYENGVPEWSTNPTFMMKQKVKTDVVPMITQMATSDEEGKYAQEINQQKQDFIAKVKNKKIKFIDAKELKSDIGHYDVGAIDSGEMEQ